MPMQIAKFTAQEYFIQDVDSGYQQVEKMPIYSMQIACMGCIEKLNDLRLLNISTTTKGLQKFKFIGMSKYERRRYDHDYTTIIIDVKTNTIKCSSNGYFGDEKDKRSKIVYSNTYFMNQEVIPFFFYLYKKYKDMNKMPSSRM